MPHTEYQNYVDYVSKNTLLDSIRLDEKSIEAYLHNISAFERVISGILIPRNATDVQVMVAGANYFGIAIYPISRGKNWGLGSKIPTGSGHIYIMDLGVSMNKIVTLDSEDGVAVIEPGVTQIQLSQALAMSNSAYVIDATGSSPESSIIGSFSDAGIGFNRLRKFDVCELTVVLGSGDLVTVSSATIETGDALNNRPLTSEMFVQTNFGIIVSAKIKLHPIYEQRQLFVMLVRTRENLGSCMKVLGREIERGSIQCIPHAFNRKRLSLSSDNSFINFVTSFFPWIIVGHLKGAHSIVRVQKKHIRQVLKKHAVSIFLGGRLICWVESLLRLVKYDAGIMAIATMRELFNVYGGQSSYLSQSSLLAINERRFHASQSDVDQLRLGLFFNSLRIPNKEDAVNEVLDMMAEAESRMGMELPHTLMLITPDAIANVVLFFFDKYDAVERQTIFDAHRMLMMQGIEKGLHPYRLDVANMDLRTPDSVSMKYIRLLKMMFDPNNVIAPSRYNISE